MVNWDIVVARQRLSPDTIYNCFESGLGLSDNIFIFQKLSKKLIEKIYLNYPGLIDWRLVIMHQKLSEKFIQKYESVFSESEFYMLPIWQKLSCSFIKKFKNKLNWMAISGHQKLTLSFLEEFQNKVDWEDISRCQKLTLPIMKRFFNNLDWDIIINERMISNSFILKNKNKIMIKLNGFY